MIDYEVLKADVIWVVVEKSATTKDKCIINCTSDKKVLAMWINEGLDVVRIEKSQITALLTTFMRG